VARESSVRNGSGISVLREINDPPIIGMAGSNSVIVNYEDINSCLGIVQGSGLVVSTAAVHLSSPSNRMRGRRKVFIQNRGPNAVFLGASGVTVSNGYSIPHSGSMELDVLDYGHLYVVSEGTSDVRILELR
jgi:hypothetical protein